jgi:G3E family GTPase
MKLKQLYPDSIFSSPEQGVQELMRGILVRTNFVPGVRHVIGWRGLKESFTNVEGWTAKIKDLPGVFGIYFENAEMDNGWINSRFGLNYFPDPEEDLVELFSLQAGAYTQREDYLSHVRNFLSCPQLCELFHIGTIELGFNKAGDALIIGLESVSRQRLVAIDGVSLPQGGRLVELIKPGGYDQNFPSYQTALAFYQVLAASFTFNLEEPPSYLRYLCRPGKDMVYDSSGHHWPVPLDDSHEEALYLGYGKASFENIIEAIADRTIPASREVSWEKGNAAIPEYKDALWWAAHQLSGYKTLDKKILGIDDRPQLIVLTGFLGSGKTSFLQHFIEYQVQLNRFVAVIQNEIGEIGLDGKLLDDDYAVTEIDEGCVCCTLVGNLKNAIHQILSSFHPDYIVLETTGLANPYNLLDEISEVNELVRFDSITTMVDGLNIEQSLKEYNVAREQIKAADILLLNKKDLLDEIQLQKVTQKLKEINPAAPILSTSQGDINPALIYGVDPQDEAMTMINVEKIQGETHQIHKSHEHEGLSSFKIPFTEPLERKQFIKAIKTIPRSIFRIKGVVEFTDADKPLLFQYVGGRFEFSEFNNPRMPDRFLILIGQNIEEDSINSIFKSTFREINVSKIKLLDVSEVES